MTLPITVVVLTKNEQANIQACLEPLLSDFSDVHVLDSGSTDQTCEIARKLGVPVYSNPFSGFGTQRNWAIDNIPHKFKWVLHIDADERLPAEFVAELRELASADSSLGGYYVPNRLMLGNHWLRYSIGYPVYQVRFFHRERLRFENHGHGQREVTSFPLGFMRQPYIHYGFSRGLEDWFQKHGRYAILEADLALNSPLSNRELLSLFFSRDQVKRRRAFKQLSFLLPARPYFRMIHMLLVRRGFRDGKAGFTYARMLAAYESMFVAALSAKRIGWDERTQFKD